MQSMPSPRITSRQNPRVKDALKLRTGRGRRRRSRIILDGAREISRALEAGVHCVEAFVCEALCESPESQHALQALEERRVELLPVSAAVYEALAFGDRADGIVVVADSPSRRLTDLQIPEQPLIAVLEGIEKPGNLGAILRSADAAGIDAIVVADGRTDLFNPNTIRASLGTVFRPNVCEATVAETLEWLVDHRLSVVVARPDADQCYTEVDLRGGVAIVLGSEADGLSDAWRSPSKNSRGLKLTAVRLPMHGMADSLNVSTTAAVMFYEALRQRK